MSEVVGLQATLRQWGRESIEAIDLFWFAPRPPHVLALLRIFTGVMLLYSHLALATDLSSFIGLDAWIDNETARGLHDGAYGYSDWGRSYLWHIESPSVIMLHHVLTLVVTASFAAGFLTRITAPLAWFLQIMYVHRLTGSLFGFDQIVTYSAMYLMLTRCGSLYSVDAWLRGRLRKKDASMTLQMDGSRSGLVAWLLPSPEPTIAANVATRLFQIHLCVIYFFGGVAKTQGTSWWDGTALWYSVGNLEYQSMDMTWLANFPRLSSLLANTTLLWELSYAFLVWPKLTRPFVILIAVLMHGGIALFLGMITFGLMMIGANLIFVPTWILSGKTGDGLGVDDDEDASLDDFELTIDLDEEIDLSNSSLSGLSGASLSGIEQEDLAERERRLVRREGRIREANAKINSRAKKLKVKETKYRDRVARLKKREAKIKEAVSRAKSRKRP